MCNSVINWRAGDQSEDLGRAAAALGKLVIDGLAMPCAPASRSKQ
jgi:hypothetical protein